MTLMIRLLGSFEVVQDGHVVGPGLDAVKPRALLALLAMQANTAVSKESLIDDLWLDPPASARNLVEKYVSLWRKVLEPGHLETVGKAYRLRLSAAESEVEDLRRRREDGRRLAAAGDHRSAAALLRAASELWRGNDVAAYASDLLPDSQAAGLVELYLCTLEEWAAVRLVVGPEPGLIESLRRAWSRHTLRERLAELLMWAYFQQGQQAEASEAYRRTCQRLTEDLGQDPGPALRDMHSRVLRHDVTLLGPVEALSSIPRVVSNLPPRGGRFIGRQEVLAELARTMHREEGDTAVRGIAVWGGVGIGKSALALEFAYRHRDEYQVVWYVNAPTRTSVADGLESLADRIGVTVCVDRDEHLHHLWERLAQAGRWLLIFDNAVRPADLVPYWPAAAGGDVVITSLNPDWGHHARPLELQVLTPAETTAFLRERTGTDESDGDAALARELDGLPLACEQAASYLRQTGMTTADYLPLFRRRRTQLLGRGTPDDHVGTIDTTWRLALAELSVVSPAAVQLLYLCAHLADEEIPLALLRSGSTLFPQELQDAVGDDLRMEDVIREVRTYSLLSREGDRLRMHCLLQAVIAGSMAEAEARGWRSRGAALLVEGAPASAMATANWAQWQLLVPHVIFVVGGLRGPADLVLGLVELIHRSSEYLVARGSFDDARTLLEQLLPVVEQDRNDTAIGLTLTGLGEVLERVGELEAALSAHERALTILQQRYGADHPWVARASSGLGRTLTCHQGVTLWRSESLPDAEDHFKQAVSTLTRTLGPEHPAVAQSLSGLGQVRQDRGDIAGGVACQEAALEIIEKAFGPEHPDAAHLQDKLGYALGLLGDHARARRCHERALSILSAAYGDGHPETGWPQSNLGLLLLDAGEPEESIAYQSRAHAIFAGDGQVVATHICAWRLARAELAVGHRDRAVARLHATAAALAARLGEDHDDVIGVRADLARARSRVWTKKTG